MLQLFKTQCRGVMMETGVGSKWDLFGVSRGAELAPVLLASFCSLSWDSQKSKEKGQVVLYDVIIIIIIIPDFPKIHQKNHKHSSFSGLSPHTHLRYASDSETLKTFTNGHTLCPQYLCQLQHNFLQQLNQMFGKLIKVAYNYAPHIKHLQTTAASIPSGLRVTYPHLNNKTHDIQNPLQTFISSLAACETATLKQVAKQKGFKLGSITWNLIESNYDLGHWMSGGGKNNKISDVYLDAEIEANLDQAEFEKVKAMTENLCPIYQVVTGSGVKVNSNWKLKKID